MPRSGNPRRAPACSIIALLLSLLVGGCGGGSAPTADPSHVAAWGAAPVNDGTTTPAAATPAPSTGGPVPVTTNPRYAFPVKTGNVDYHPTHSAYPATDIFAACGSPVVAVTDGRILEISLVDQFDKRGPDGPFNGGRSVSLLGDDGVRYYGSHLVEVTAGIAAGVRVRAGTRIGSVGHTGNANNVCHLHFGISPPCQGTGDWWIRRGVIWPAEFLDAWHKKVNKSPVGKVNSWHRARGCPKAP